MFNKQVLLLSVWILLTVFVISCQANEEEESAKENTKRNEHEAAFKNDEAMKVASAKRKAKEASRLREFFYIFRRLLREKGKGIKREEYSESMPAETRETPAKPEIIVEEENQNLETKREFENSKLEDNENENIYARENVNRKNEVFNHKGETEKNKKERKREEREQKIDQEEKQMKREENVEKDFENEEENVREWKPLLESEEEEGSEEKLLRSNRGFHRKSQVKRISLLFILDYYPRNNPYKQNKKVVKKKYKIKNKNIIQI